MLFRLPDYFEATKCTPGFVKPGLSVTLDTAICTDNTRELFQHVLAVLHQR